MNIFYLDHDFDLAAKWLCNRHISKMPSESSNLLLWPIKEQYPEVELPLAKNGNPVILTHKNHPVTKWVRESFSNYRWAFNNFIAMCNEYSDRYHRIHFSSNYIEFIEKFISKIKFPTNEMTQIKGCFGDFKIQLQEIKSPVEAYRKYYELDKCDFARWPSENKVPHWYLPEVNRTKLIDSSFENGVYTKRP